MIRIFLKLLKKTRAFFIWLWQQEGTPSQCARGVAGGVFSGCFPLFGLQTLLGVSLASLFKGNHLLAAAATWISNPFTYIPLYLFNYKVGSAFLGEGRNFNTLRQLNTQELWDQGWIISSRILLGSSIVGSILAIIIGLISYLLFIKFSQKKNV